MNIDQAKILQAALSTAIATAEANGQGEIDLRSTLQAADDSARAELESAIAPLLHRAGQPRD